MCRLPWPRSRTSRRPGSGRRGPRAAPGSPRSQRRDRTLPIPTTPAAEVAESTPVKNSARDSEADSRAFSLKINVGITAAAAAARSCLSSSESFGTSKPVTAMTSRSATVPQLMASDEDARVRRVEQDQAAGEGEEHQPPGTVMDRRVRPGPLGGPGEQAAAPSPTAHRRGRLPGAGPPPRRPGRSV